MKIEDEGVITPKAIHSHSNELANFSTSNVLDLLNNLLHNRNSLPFGDEKKMAFEPNPNSLVLLNVNIVILIYLNKILFFKLQFLEKKKD